MNKIQSKLRTIPTVTYLFLIGQHKHLFSLCQRGQANPSSFQSFSNFH